VRNEPQQSEDATFVIGPFDSIEDVDAGACKLVGYSRAELLQMHGSELVPVERHNATAVSLDRMRGGNINFRIGVLRRKDGVTVTVAVRAQVLGEGRLRLTVSQRTI
jgi:PAS domain S-box-containing protein